MKKGWRYTLPNLEQTALLKVEYNTLDKLCSLDDKFKGIGFFETISPATRKEVLSQLLNFFRTNYSIYHRFLIDERSETEMFLKNKLDEKKLWSLDSKETIEAPTYMVAVRPGRSTQKGIYFATMGLRSGIGKFIKRKMQENGFDPLRQDQYRIMIERLCDLLVRANFLSRRENLRGSGGVMNGYLLRSDNLIWLAGDGETDAVGATRINAYKNLMIVPNMYFHFLQPHFHCYC